MIQESILEGHAVEMERSIRRALEVRDDKGLN